jgi:hypothetical protein
MNDDDNDEKQGVIAELIKSTAQICSPTNLVLLRFHLGNAHL